MTHRVTVKVIGGWGPKPAPATYDVDADDAMAAHTLAGDRYRAEWLAGQKVLGWFLLTAREEVSPC